MKWIFLAGVLGVATLSSGRIEAQCDSGGGPATLTINGILPSSVDPVGHLVNTQYQPWSLEIGDGVGGRPFVLAAGGSIGCPGFATPWGGSIDVVAPFVVLDGLNPQTIFDYFAITNFSTTLPPVGGNCFAGSGPALQAVCVDPTNPPFGLRNTQSGQPTVSSSRVTVYTSLGDDESHNHALSACPITFGGTIYSSLNIGSNGQICFAVGSIDFSPSAAEFFNGFRLALTPGSNPGVANLWADYNRLTSVGDNITVIEDTIGDTVVVAYNNQQHWNSQSPAGSWKVTFGALGPDSVVFDFTGYSAGLAADQNKIVGVTDGTNVAGGVDTNADLSNLILTSGGAYNSSGIGPESIMEEFLDVSPPDFTTISFVHVGGFQWTVF